MNLTGIAVLPDDEFADVLIEFQSRHSSLVDGPVLGRSSNLPHVSILQCPYTDELPSERILSELARVARKHNHLTIDLQRVRYQPVGWLFLGVARTEWLDAVHDCGLGITEPYIDRGAIDLTKDMSGYSELEYLNYTRYGYRYIGRAYQPHFTLGRIDRTAYEQTALDGAFDAFLEENGISSPRADRLVVYRAGLHGALDTVLAEESLR
jgi:2'-5' RNA ligase